MPKTARKIDYIRLRPGSSNWTIRLQFPDGKDSVRSLGTPDRRQAEILALPIIEKHKKALLALRPRIEVTWQYKLEPGRLHSAPDGGQILATDKELSYIGHNGHVIRTEPNGGPAHQLIGDPLTVRSLAEAFIDADFGTGRGERRAAATAKGTDDAILGTYLSHANVTGYYEREARATWALFKTLCKKSLKDADRDDGRKLAAHFEGEGLKSATITKKIGWLTSAVNLAIKEGKLKFNPFSGVVPQRDDAQRRLPLSDADIAEAKCKLDKLSDADQLLFRVLATTGMRLSEAFQIDGEGIEGGVRFVIVGKKTDQSLRRVPLPRHLLPHLPAKIKGRLFPLTAGTLKRTSDAASKRLMRFLRDDCGITDAAKVVHSLRHRAKDRARAVGCPLNVQYELFGHEEKTIALWRRLACTVAQKVGRPHRFLNSARRTMRDLASEPSLARERLRHT
jgi:integrase